VPDHNLAVDGMEYPVFQWRHELSSAGLLYVEKFIQ
jgi:hypothetical protein